MNLNCDVLVLGAGMVGVSAALALQARGRDVVLVDRRGVAEETSHGNAGIIQREAVVPYSFPRDWKVVIDYALNRRTEAHLHHWDLMGLAPWLWEHFQNSAPDRVEAAARAARPLVERCIDEHEALMRPAGIADVIRHTGYLRVYRSAERLAADSAASASAAARWGVVTESIDLARLREIEPHLHGPLVGGLLKPQAVSVSDPGAVGKAYAALFQQRGGRFVTADARAIEPAGGCWRLSGARPAIEARDVVVALGPWSNEVLRPLGIELPLIGKRGYHKHYAAQHGAALSRPVFDVEVGYVLAPMARGIRLTTGAEFARLDAAPTPVQVEKSEPRAREIFPLGDALDQEAWLGRRPCLPDMLPAIGPVPGKPGLWLDFGHHHLGFTLGPVSARLLAQLMSGEAPFTDPAPYRPERFA
ncbi:MAG: FAD-binding oxidoreductase [Betaproteobacteria bacterium]|nr:FAD-binding oxidoreductase [Betaproteobacteria bacterium]